MKKTDLIGSDEEIEMTEKEKMLAGMLYDPSDRELTALLVKARKLARRYNQIVEDEPEKRKLF